MGAGTNRATATTMAMVVDAGRGRGGGMGRTRTEMARAGRRHVAMGCVVVPSCRHIGMRMGKGRGGTEERAKEMIRTAATAAITQRIRPCACMIASERATAMVSLSWDGEGGHVIDVVVVVPLCRCGTGTQGESGGDGHRRDRCNVVLSFSFSFSFSSCCFGCLLVVVPLIVASFVSESLPWGHRPRPL
jgi:hypothetical protein